MISQQHVLPSGRFPLTKPAHIFNNGSPHDPGLPQSFSFFVQPPLLKSAILHVPPEKFVEALILLSGVLLRVPGFVMLRFVSWGFMVFKIT